MHAFKKNIAGLIAFAFLSGLIGPPAATGITIKEEEDLAREFLRYVTLQLEIIDDPIIVDYVNSVGKRILAKLPPQPFPYHFYVVNQEVYNAFATPAGHVFIYSGLIAAMDNEDELAGILAHEISHVTCRHISQKIERSKLINIATLAGIAAGILIGAAGGGEAAGALTMGSMAAGQSASLAYSRENEIQADQVGMVYLTEAGYTGEGLVSVLNKIREKQWYGSDQVPTYLMTHPALEDRMAYIDTYLASRKKELQASRPVNTKAFQLAHARLIALYGDEKVALSTFEAALRSETADAITYYGYGLALARAGKNEQAVTALKKALETEAFNPIFLAGLGRVYFLDRRYQEALTTIASALSLDPQEPEALFFLGRTRLELDQPEEAQSAFERLLKQEIVAKQVYYFLGKAYGQEGKLAEAFLNLGRYYYLKHDFANARIHFKQALEKTQDPDQRREIEGRLKEIEKTLKALKES
ncbi:MAG: M48 family metalloprotease [Desulfobacterales bacterium]|jgi:predicted Zn-dependent protease